MFVKRNSFVYLGKSIAGFVRKTKSLGDMGKVKNITAIDFSKKTKMESNIEMIDEEKVNIHIYTGGYGCSIIFGD